MVAVSPFSSNHVFASLILASWEVPQGRVIGATCHSAQWRRGQALTPPSVSLREGCWLQAPAQEEPQAPCAHILQFLTLTLDQIHAPCWEEAHGRLGASGGCTWTPCDVRGGGDLFSAHIPLRRASQSATEILNCRPRLPVCSRGKTPLAFSRQREQKPPSPGVPGPHPAAGCTPSPRPPAGSALATRTLSWLPWPPLTCPSGHGRPGPPSL